MNSLFLAIRRSLRNKFDQKYERRIANAFSPIKAESSHLIIRIKSDNLNRSYKVPESYDRINKEYWYSPQKRIRPSINNEYHLKRETAYYKIISKHK